MGRRSTKRGAVERGNHAATHVGGMKKSREDADMHTATRSVSSTHVYGNVQAFRAGLVINTVQCREVRVLQRFFDGNTVVRVELQHAGQQVHSLQPNT